MSNRTTFVKVYTDLDDHPAWIDLDPEHVGLWLLALLYCRRNLTDGHFPERLIRRWGGAAESADRLVAAGRWHRAGHDCTECPPLEGGEVYVHGYLEVQNSRTEYDALRVKRAAAGAVGGKERARRKQLADQTASNGKQEASRSNLEVEVEVEKDTTATAAAFAEFWGHYPRKAGKAAAERAHAKALKSTDAVTILAGLRNAVQVWTAARTEPQFIPHPATWLNQGRWADEHPTLETGAGPARPVLTLNLCDGTDCPGSRHEWTDQHGRNRFVCPGVDA